MLCGSRKNMAIIIKDESGIIKETVNFDDRFRERDTIRAEKSYANNRLRENKIRIYPDKIAFSDATSGKFLLVVYSEGAKLRFSDSKDELKMLKSERFPGTDARIMSSSARRYGNRYFPDFKYYTIFGDGIFDLSCDDGYYAIIHPRK